MAKKDIIYNNKIFAISYEILNYNEDDIIVFLHGWGSNKEIMKQAFGSSFTGYKHIYIDMPGFGKSHTQEVLNSYDYVEILKIFLEDYKDFILIGHSFGGKIGILLEPKTIILLSSAGILEKKSIKTIFKIKLFKLLKLLGFGSLYKFFASKDVNNMSSNMYETFKNVVNEDWSQNFANFTNQAYIFGGDSDTAVSIQSNQKIASLIKNSKFYELKGDHYFFLNRQNIIQIEKSIID
jgi:pimeloyl-ACP methyl ester carboxylesterase